MTHPRTRFALALLAALTVLATLPAASRAGVGHQVLFHAASTTNPNDTDFSLQWPLHDSGSSIYATAGGDIDIQQAWADHRDGDGVTVAVVDTGVSTEQPDLQGQFSPTVAGSFAPIDDGCTKTTPVPDHGTAIVGVVAALRDNGTGVAGIAPAAKILPVRALDDCGGGTLDSVLAGFGYAADHGAQIAVGSFATDPWLSAAAKSEIARRFQDFFVDHPGTLFVVAAGNEGNDNDSRPVYPCNATADNVLCVGASNVDDSPRCSSNYGAQSVDLFAPGDRIWTTVRTGTGSAAMSGTSLAAPMAAGVAALAWPALQHRTAANLAEALRVGVDPRKTMTDISVAGGRLNAAGAVGLTRYDQLGPVQGNPCADADGDGVNDALDRCPGVASSGPQGCPLDTDADGVPDASDDCPDVANPGQADEDGDGIGDACDTDRDGDRVANGVDACPDQYNATSTGCPVVPTPPPAVTPSPAATPTPVPTVVPLRIMSVAVKVAHDHRTARVRVRLSRTASTAVTVERWSKRGHRHRWTRVATRAFAATAGGRALTVPTRTRGTYRVTVTLSGARTARHSFRV